MSQTRMCPNNHVLDARWDRCPYCPAPPIGPGGGNPGGSMPGAHVAPPARMPVPATRVGLAPAFPGMGPAPVPPPGVAGPLPAPAPIIPHPARRGRQTVIRVVEEEKEKALPLVGWLLILSGPQRGEDFRLREGKNSVGSEAGNDIVIADPHVSSRHATINTLLKDGERVFVLRDLDSANGTFLNTDEEPRFYEELVDNDTVKFGTVVCKFKCV